jgi:putative membrane protein
MRLGTLFTLAALGLTAAAVLADDTKRGDEKLTDQQFIAKATSGGMFEVKSSQLALQMGTSANVKRFAQQMVTDHTKANQELSALLARKGLQAPAAMDEKHLEMVNKLAKLQSNEFDKAYWDMQLKAHEKTVELFENAAKNLQDRDLKAWAAKTLPTLREHLQMAQRMSGHTGANTGTNTGTRTRTGNTVPPGGY